MYIEDLFPDLELESKTVEYKGIIEEGKKDKGRNCEIGWLRTIAAFANTEGGKMVIGVENDTHKIVALDKKTADKTILMIHRQISERIEPKISYDVKSITIPAAGEIRFIIEVFVEKSNDLPVILHDGGMLGIYVRNFGRTDIATPEQIRDLILMSDNTPFDTAVTDKEYDKKNYSRLYETFTERNSGITEKALISMGAVTQDKKVTRGMLLFADDCDDLRTKVVATEWPGFDKGGSIVTASEEYVGDLITVINKSIEFIKSHSATGFKKEETRNVPYISFPARSVTEGVVNAVGHRNYYMLGTQIEINIFRDRLEITSPGALLGVRYLYREKDIASIIPRRRNEVICNILEKCKLMEKKGSGFDNIEADYAEAGEAFAPFISTDANSFTLTLPDLTFTKGVTEQDEDSPEVYIQEVQEGKNDLKILSYCYNKKRSVREIADWIGVTPSTYFRKNVIDRLVGNGFLREIRDTKGKKYISDGEKVKIR